MTWLETEMDFSLKAVSDLNRKNFARPTTKNSFSEQLLDLCHGDSFFVWNLLSIENAKLCRLKYYLPYVGSMMQYNKTLWFLIETIHLRWVSSTPFGAPFCLPLQFYKWSSSPVIICKWLFQKDFNNISESFQNLFVVVFT